jgi:hypothetical protein
VCVFVFVFVQEITARVSAELGRGVADVTQPAGLVHTCLLDSDLPVLFFRWMDHRLSAFSLSWF